MYQFVILSNDNNVYAINGDSSNIVNVSDCAGATSIEARKNAFVYCVVDGKIIEIVTLRGKQIKLESYYNNNNITANKDKSLVMTSEIGFYPCLYIINKGNVIIIALSLPQIRFVFTKPLILNKELSTIIVNERLLLFNNKTLRFRSISKNTKDYLVLYRGVTQERKNYRKN